MLKNKNAMLDSHLVPSQINVLTANSDKCPVILLEFLEIFYFFTNLWKKSTEYFIGILTEYDKTN